MNPRLVEPANAHRSGVDLVAALLDVACGAALHAPVRAGREDVRTHQLLLAVLGAAEQDRGRRGVVAELWTAARGAGSYRASTEELTPVRGDWRAATPVVLAASATLIAPSAWSWFSNGSVTNYALSPEGWRAILAMVSASRS